MPTYLAPPTITGPVSPHSTHITLSGQLAGAQVQVWGSKNSNTPIVDAQASFPHQSFAVIRAPIEGEELRARQILGNFAWEWTPLGSPPRIIVMNQPQQGDLLPVGLVSHPYVCGECIWFDGAYPGATVTLFAGNQQLGSREAFDSDARLYGLARPLRPNDTPPTLAAHQALISKNLVSASTFINTPDPFPSVALVQQPLPPTIRTPIYDCQQYVGIDNVNDGAFALLRRNGDTNPSDWACFDVSALWMHVDPPLKAGDTATASQRFRGCGLESDEAQSVPVLDQPPPAPALGMLCRGASSIEVAALVPGAELWFYSDQGAGKEFPDDPDLVVSVWKDVCDVQIPSELWSNLWNSAHWVSAQQITCRPKTGGRPSKSSGHRKTIQSPAVTPPVINQPKPGPFECAVVVRVENVVPNSAVYIRSQYWGTIVGGAKVEGGASFVDVPLSIPLRYPDSITPGALICGQASDGQPVPVQQFAADDAYKVPVIDNVNQTVVDCRPIVIRNLPPGTRVDVYTDGAYWKTFRSPLDVYVVEERMPPSVKKVKAMQRICGAFSAFSNEVTLVQGTVTLVPGSVDRICQLDGFPDAAAAYPNQTRPLGKVTNIIKGGDFGLPVDHNGQLFFFFADADFFQAVDSRGVDAIASTWATSGDTCPDLDFLTYVDTNKNEVAGFFSVSGQDPLKAGEGPLGLFSYSGRVYAFINKQVDPNDPSKGYLMYLAGAPDPTDAFSLEYVVNGIAQPFAVWPKGGVVGGFQDFSAHVIRNADWPLLPQQTGDGLLLFASNVDDVFLMWAPLTPGNPPPSPLDSNGHYDNTAWRYLAGLNGNGDPIWSAARADTKGNGLWTLSGQGSKLLSQHVGGTARVQKFSVEWVPSLRRWLLLWGSDFENPAGKTINGATSAVVARLPWGPWESVAPGDGFSGSPNLFNAEANFPWGQSAAYSPNIIRRFTRFDPANGETTLFHTISFDYRIGRKKEDADKLSYSYNVHLMKVVLSCV